MAKETVIGLHDPDAALPRPAPTGFEGNALDDAVRDLISTYHSLNPPSITILDSEPSPLEFMRHVSQNRPFVIRNGAQDWKARKQWNATYLRNTMRSSRVNVALTPSGNADSILDLQDGKKLFVKPYETSEPFQSVLAQIQDQELSIRNGMSGSSGPTLYAQTQNDNLRNEYSALFSDIPKSIPFARIALQKDPDAINFWLGNSHSTTALHKDNYENIYVQILGSKHFLLLPPISSPCVNERSVLAATYTSYPHSSTTTSSMELIPQIDEPRMYTPFATWDPDRPEENATRFSHLAQPMRVTLGEGDMLYLPALWYHKVGQSCNVEGICCAVNYWYDFDFSGGFWSMAMFTRGVGLLSLGSQGQKEKQKKGEEEEGAQDMEIGQSGA